MKKHYSYLLQLVLLMFMTGVSFGQNSGIYESSVIIDSGSGNQQFDLFSPTDSTNDTGYFDYDGSYFGSFGSQNGTLLLNGAENKIWKCNATDDIINGWLHYMIYETGNRPNPVDFLSINLAWFSNDIGAACGTNGDNQVWKTDNEGLNLLDGLTTGNYTLEVFTFADYTVGGILQLNPHYVNNNANNFKATFDVDNPPEAICVTELTVPLGATGTASITSNDIDGGSTDDIGIASLAIDVDTFDCNDIGTPVLVTLTVTDSIGQTDTCTVLVTVVDNIPPTLSAVGNRNENVDVDCNFTIPDYTGLTTAADNCTALTVTQSPASGTVLNGSGTVQTITLSTTDGTNPVSITFDVTLVDNSPPTLSAVGNRDENVDVDCNFTIPDYTGLTTAADNCAALTVTQSPASGTVLNGAGTVQTITLSTTDGTNPVSTTFDVTLVDYQAPIAICQPRTIILNTGGNASVTAAQIDGGSTDNCGIASISLDKYNFTCSDLGDNTVTLTVIDTAGNVSTCTSIVTVESPTEDASVTIASNDPNDEICSGSSITFTATPINGGTTQYYEWFINGISEGTTVAPTFTPNTTPTSNFEIYVRRTTDITACGPIQSPTLNITVIPPPVISFPSEVCIGRNTYQLTPSSGGTWTSNNTNIATITPNSGVITGLAPGSVTFTYVSPSTGCSITTDPIILNPLRTINAPATMCVGETYGLSPSTGGRWLSSDTRIATIIEETGVITAVGPGSVVFRFIDRITGCTSYSSQTEVQEISNIRSITVSNDPVCAGDPTILTSIVQGTGNYAETLVNYTFDSGNDYSELIDHSTTPGINSSFSSPSGENYIPFDNTRNGTPGGAFTNNLAVGRSLRQLDDWRDGGIYGGTDDSGDWLLNVDGPALVNYQNLRVSFQYRRGSRFGDSKYIRVDYRVGNSGAWTSNTVYVQKGNAYFTNNWIYATFSLPPSFDNVSSIQFRLSVDDGSTFNPCTIGSDGCPDGATAIAEPHIYIDNLQVQGSAFDDSVVHSWSANTGTAAGLPTSATIPSINNDIITVNPEVTTEYTLTVTNANGCETTETVTVNVHPSPEIIINADYCPEDDPSTPDRDESNMVQLIASANQSITSWEWNTGETGNTIYVDTAGQYQVIGTTVNGCSQAVTIQVAQELVVNGDFSMGNSDFDSDYTYYANLQNVNGYAITTDGNTVSPDFYGPDHTDGTGNFMAVNSNGSSNVVWRQTVNVEAGVEYFFSAWARSLNASGPFGKLAFRVNGIQMGAQLDLDAYPTNDWSRFNGTWTSTVDGAILIEIINNEPSPVENNFGIDDISFATLSTFINLTSHIGSIDQTVCENMPIETITYEVGGGLTGPTITGLPAGLDTTFDGLVFTISGIPTESGTFNYTIDINASCGNKTASGVIVVNPAPVVTITTPSQTICQSEGTITLSATLSGSATGGTWTTNGTGNFTPSATDPNATYNFGSAETGDITLTFTSNNPDGPCEATVETLDIEITPYIIATVGENQTTANCDINTVTLTGNNVTGQWTASPNTGYFSDPSVYNSTFTGESGETYTLTWTATNTGVCTDNTTATMTVTIPDCGTNLVFNGVNEYINFGDHYNLSGPFSIEAWIKPANVTGTKTIISKRNGTALTDGYDLSLIGNRLYFRYNNANPAIDATQAMNPNQWYHVAVTYDGANYILYIDGFQLRNRAGSAPSINNNKALIGAMDRTNNLPINYFNGGIDEVRIWNTALTETQIREMMNQEIEAHGTNVRGIVIPMDIAGLQWSDLRGYYQMNTGPQTSVASGIIQNITSIPVPGTLNGMTSDQEETAPIPYRSIADSNWDSPTTWSAESVQQIPNSIINNIRPGLYQTWNIVRTANNITAENKNFTVLGLFIDANKLAIQNSDPFNGHSLEVTKYLNIADDAILDLVGESQLLQGEGSILGPGTGVLERDQQGTGNMFNYNYWGSPVTNAETAGERTYSLSGILFDGNDPVQWTGGLNGSQTSPLTLSTRWLYTFENRDFDDYNGWNRITQNTAIKVGLGFLMKGTGPQGSFDQNYTFRGRPNNGDITITINPSELTTLLGNPYPSAIDASEFIKENETSLKEGTLIFWEQAPSNNSHYLAAYQGRYSYLNMLGGLSAATPPGIANSGDATKEPKNAVPVGQGFFVTGSNDGGDVIFKNSHRIFVTETSGGSVFLRNSEDSTKILKTQGEAPLYEDNIQRVRFAFTTPENATRHLLLGFTPDNDATDGIDYGYDASNSDDFPSDLSFAIEGRKFVIQGVGSFDINKKYPLDMTLGITGNVELALTGLENFEETIDVYVHDALLDTYTRINTVGFQTNLEAGNYSGRFSIVFQPDTTLDIIDQDFKDISVKYLQKTDEIYVKTPASIEVHQVYLVNMAGQAVRSWNMTNMNFAQEFKILVKNISEGNYVLKVETNTNSYNKKVIIKF